MKWFIVAFAFVASAFAYPSSTSINITALIEEAIEEGITNVYQIVEAAEQMGTLVSNELPSVIQNATEAAEALIQNATAQANELINEQMAVAEADLQNATAIVSSEAAIIQEQAAEAVQQLENMTQSIISKLSFLG